MEKKPRQWPPEGHRFFGSLEDEIKRANDELAWQLYFQEIQSDEAFANLVSTYPPGALDVSVVRETEPADDGLGPDQASVSPTEDKIDAEVGLPLAPMTPRPKTQRGPKPGTTGLVEVDREQCIKFIQFVTEGRFRSEDDALLKYVRAADLTKLWNIKEDSAKRRLRKSLKEFDRSQVPPSISLLNP